MINCHLGEGWIEVCFIKIYWLNPKNYLWMRTMIQHCTTQRSLDKVKKRFLVKASQSFIFLFFLNTDLCSLGWIPAFILWSLLNRSPCWQVQSVSGILINVLAKCSQEFSAGADEIFPHWKQTASTWTRGPLMKNWQVVVSYATLCWVSFWVRV